MNENNLTSGQKRRRRKKRINRYTVILVILAAVMVIGIGLLLYFLLKDRNPEQGESFPSVPITSEGETLESAEPAPVSEYESVLAKARTLAGMYDYDAAVSLVKESVPEYETVPELSAFLQECSANKAKLVKWSDNSNITHVFFHTLIADAEKAFASFKSKDYNEVMTTIEEFDAIMESMYEKGYVLVHLSDIAKIETQPDGSKQMVYQPIYLPEGKIPFVLSVDDVSYYEYMNNTGFASRLIIDEDGRIVNEMDIYEEAVPKQTDGRTGGPLLATDEYGKPLVASTVRGDFDVVPRLDRFVEAHPDFSYRGAKGTIALTGYNGVLGYRTSEITYGSKDPAKVDLTIYEKWPKTYNYQNITIEEDRVKAKEVADAMKAEGWKFASHTWGHMNMSSATEEHLHRDSTWWANEVLPIIGPTDIIIFAFGADIGSWRGYTEDNAAFMYLKSMGFDYFCNVDGSTPAWVQLNKTAGGSGYLRMGRRNLDGMLMFKQLVNPDKHILDDLFDVKKVFDRRRPIPVSGVTVPEGVDLNHLFD